MSKSTHQIVAKGVDQTAKTFQSIQARAIATGRRISAVMGGAIAAAGAYLSVRAIKGGIDELSHLSDIAMKAGVASGELQQMSDALGVLGIQGASVDSLSRGLAIMNKNTGRSGMAGFYETISEISKIPGEAERAKAAVQTFGRSGLDFMPLINGAKDGTKALQDVMAAFPKVSEAAANSADDIADGLSILTGEFKSLWYEALGTVAGWVSDEFGGSFRSSMLALSAWMSYWAKNTADMLLRTFRPVTAFFSALGSMSGALAGGVAEKLLGSGGSWADVVKGVGDAWRTEFDNLETDMDDIDDRMQARADELTKRLEAIRKFQGNYDAAAKGSSKSAGEEAAAAASRPRISNTLISGGSNAASRLVALGPDYQNESRKQTRLLEDIAKNTKKTAEADGEDYAATDL